MSVGLPGPWRYRAAGAGTVALAASGLVLGLVAPMVPIVPIVLVWVGVLFFSAWWASSGHALRMVGWGVFMVVALCIGIDFVPGFSPIPFVVAA